MADPSTEQLALACGTAGAFVDISDDLVAGSVSGSWGRTSVFSDTSPGVLQFDLVNDTGKYTQGNPLTSLATAVHVGMGVHHIVDGIHYGGTIRSATPYFIGDHAAAGSALVRVVCDDMLGTAARCKLENLAYSAAQGSSYFFYPFNEPEGSQASFDQSGNNGPALASITPLQPVFGANGNPITLDDQMSATATASQFFTMLAGPGTGTVPIVPTPYPAGSLGFMGFWVIPGLGSTGWDCELIWGGVGTTSLTLGNNVGLGLLAAILQGGVNLTVTAPVLQAGVLVYLAAGLTYVLAGSTYTYTLTIYVNGVSVASGSVSTSVLIPPVVVAAAFSIIDVADTVVISHFSHSPVLIHEEFAGPTVEAIRLALIDQTTTQITLATLPAALSTASLGVANTQNQSTLDALNDVIRTEQGHIWAETTGSLLSPSQSIKVRERDRPTIIDAAHSFDISEILNSIDFTTDVENMVYAATAQGPAASATESDATLIQYAGPATDSATVLLLNTLDLLAWAQDRLRRGAALDVRIPQFTIDALLINRWVDVSALRNGDRIRITGLPAQQFGVDHIDGWLLGCSWSLNYHALDDKNQSALFTFSLQPCTPNPATYSAASRYAAGGTMSIGAVNSSATSFTVTSTDPLSLLGTADLPYTMLVDAEQVTVTAVSGSSSPQTATVTRGANSTTAAAHSAGAPIDVYPLSYYGY